MNLSELSIKRPVTIIMAILIVLVLGIYSFIKIPIDLMPAIDFPMAIVTTNYKGVGPQEIENFVTKNVENALSTVSNLKSLQSQSSEGTSLIMAEFNDGTEMNYATLQIREKIDLVEKFFPSGVENPMVIKMDPNLLPAAQISVMSNKQKQVDLKDFVENTIKARMERLDGVAAANVSGGVAREIKVDINPNKMSNYGLSYNQIIATLQTENINQPGGSVQYGNKKLLIRNVGQFNSLEDIKNIPIILPQGNIVYLRDVAQVKEGVQTQSTYTRMNGINSIGLSVQKQTGSNTVKVVNNIKKEMDNLNKQFPEIQLKLVFDQGLYVEKSINNLTHEGMLGAIFAVVVIFLFLLNIRSTLIISISIPISIISTFVMMFFNNMTLNIISMGGLALGIGRIVDDAIVVQDNIFRLRSEGYSMKEAALLGVKGVRGAIVASTLTTIAVFLPIVFAQGVAAKMFKEMAMTVTLSLLASLVVAMTIVPMLSSKLLKKSKKQIDPEEKEPVKKQNLLEIFFNGLYSFYGKFLKFALGHRKLCIFVVFILFLGSLAAIPFIGFEFIPKTDQGQFTVSIKLAEGALLNETSKVTEQVEKYISQISEIEKVFVTIGGGGSIIISTSSDSNSASINATLYPLSQRKKSTSLVVEELRKKTDLIPGARIKITEASSTMGGGAMGGSSAPVSIGIKGYDLNTLKSIALDIEKTIKDIRGLRQIETSIAKGRPELGIFIDRDKAALFGLGSTQIASSIKTSIDGAVATRYKLKGNEIDVRVELEENGRNTFEKLKDLKISSPTGISIPLTELTTNKIQEGPTSITRKNQTRFVTVTSDLFDRDVGSASKEISEKLKNIKLADGYTIEYGGQNQQMMESFVSLLQALLVSILLIYMIMAAEFESLLQPFIIMFSVPLAFSGATLGLALTGRTFNVPAFIGLIMLTGIVVSNAIVLIDYVNHLRKEGLSSREAILKAGPIRLRPILMTTLATVLAMMPLMLGIGEGSEVQAPLATVIVFGMLFSTILTLIIVPVIYTIFEDIKDRFIKKKQDIETV